MASFKAFQCFIVYFMLSNSKETQTGETPSQIGRRVRDGFAEVNLDDFKVVGASYTTKAGTRKQKARQYCHGLPIFGAGIVIESNEDGSNPVACHGLFYQCNDIQFDLTKSNNINRAEAGKLVIGPAAEGPITTNSATMQIYFDEQYQQHLVWVLSVSGVSAESGVFSWFSIVDVNSGEILLKADTSEQVTVNDIGGNILFGPIAHEFDLPSYPNLMNENVVIRDYTTGQIIQCVSTSDCLDDQVNGGFGQAADAYQFGNDVFDLYQEWADGLTPIAAEHIPLVINIHWPLNDNARYDGATNELTFGDGNTQFYPLVSLDVLAHEAAHAFTDTIGADLVYQGESGGMNEAYSDLAGQAGMNFVNGYNSWRVGHGLLQLTYGHPIQSLRHMFNPPDDQVSVDVWSANSASLNVHYSSGIYNKAYYLLYAYGWTTQQIFQVATKANEIYWLASTTMHEGVYGFISAVVDLFGEDQSLLDDVYQAFKTVNLYVMTYTTVYSEDGLSGNAGDELSFQYSNEDSVEFKIITFGGTGDADLYVKFGSAPDPSQYDCGSSSSTNNEQCTFSTPQIGIYYIIIHAWSAIDSVSWAVQKFDSDESDTPVEKCTFKPLDIADKSVWVTSNLIGGTEWLITHNEDGLWISNNELITRTIDIEFAKFCAMSVSDYRITVTGRAAGTEPDYSDLYRLEVDFKSVDGDIEYAFDTGFVTTASDYTDYIASYDNVAGIVTTITITEWAKGTEDSECGYSGTALMLPCIELSTETDHPTSDPTTVPTTIAPTNDPTSVPTALIPDFGMESEEMEFGGVAMFEAAESNTDSQNRDIYFMELNMNWTWICIFLVVVYGINSGFWYCYSYCNKKQSVEIRP